MTKNGKEEESNHALNTLFLDLKQKLPEFFPNNESKLKAAILKTSDQFVFKENKSQWNQSWFQIGYLNYFMPMQFVRIEKALKECLKAYPNLEQEISSVVDFGSGPGLAALVFKNYFKNLPPSWTNVDENKVAHELAEKVYKSLDLKNPFIFKTSNTIEPSKREKELILLSYSLCEGINEENIFTYDHVFILEPSTRENSRALIKIRECALNKGYSIIAPCTHCEACPMLKRKNDWCHDSVEKPKIDSLMNLKLPFSEKNLGFSYLFLSKKISTNDLTNANQARVVGDFLKEKGKTKVAICQSSERQFLSWLKRSKYSPTFRRGDTVKVSSNATIKGQEIRIIAD